MNWFSKLKFGFSKLKFGFNKLKLSQNLSSSENNDNGEDKLIPILKNISSQEDLTQLLHSADAVKVISSWAEEINKKEYCKILGTFNPILLYHGSPHMGLNELKLEKGRRSGGFMGSTKHVDNLGVFLTDSISLAMYFGENRSDYGDRKIYAAYCKIDNLLDSNSMPPSLRKKGLDLINSYEGTLKHTLAQRDIWWLLDQLDFVNKIKELGFDSMRFKESLAIRKESKSFDAFTYFIMDPSNIVIKNKNNDIIKDFTSLWSYISPMLSNSGRKGTTT